MSGPGPLSPAIAVTGARIVAIPGIVALILVDDPAARWCAAGLYAAAAVSDRLDGRLARARGQVTVAGAFLDPLADRLLVAAALIALVQIGEVGAWAAVVLIALEFAVSGLRLVAVSEDVIIPAGRFARVAALILDVTLVALIVPQTPGALADGLVYAAVALTTLSGAHDLLTVRRRLFARKAPDRA